MIVLSVLKKKYFVRDIIIALIIMVLPFLFYVYTLIPSDLEVWETRFFVFGHGGFYDVQFFLWNINVKLLVILFLAIWFTTSKHWWKYSILVPLVIESMKFMNLLRKDVGFIDEMDFIYSLPVTIPIIIFLIFLSKKLGYYSMSLDVSDELSGEINDVFNELTEEKGDKILRLRQSLDQLRKEKGKMNKALYLKQLLIIKKQSLDL